jgi:hypothetical protein
MAAELVIADKVVFDDGAIQEMVVWRVPAPVPPSSHAFKYRMFYGFPGRRLVGYDNERERVIIATMTAARSHMTSAAGKR